MSYRKMTYRWSATNAIGTGYVEKPGSGTLRILAALEKAGLPRPEFKEAFAGFQVVFYRDWLTEERLGELGLNERQVKAVLYVKEKGSTTNREYRGLFSVSKATASRELKELVDAGIFEKIGKTGRSVRYILRGQTDPIMGGGVMGNPTKSANSMATPTGHGKTNKSFKKFCYNCSGG